MASETPKRKLGSSDLLVSPVGFGCWPIAGVSSLGVNEPDSLATIHAALDCGINLVDTAFSYGANGEADLLLAQVLKTRRDEVVLCSKVGQYLEQTNQRVIAGRPGQLIAQAEQVVKRLRVEAVDVMYLHVADPKVPVADSAGALAEIVHRGWAKYAGASNLDSQQLAEFHRECPIVVVQPPFNMLQQEALTAISGFCRRNGIGVACYWALMKGLLAGRLARDHQFDPQDKRLTYPIFQGQAWQRSQDLLDKLRQLAQQLNCTVAQLVVGWTIRQPGITVALCGAKRPDQITETAAAMHLDLAASTLAEIDGWIAETELPF